MGKGAEVKGGKGTESGKTKGSAGISGVGTGVGSARGTRKNPGSIGWPGVGDSRLPSSGNDQSAKS